MALSGGVFAGRPAGAVCLGWLATETVAASRSSRSSNSADAVTRQVETSAPGAATGRIRRLARGATLEARCALLQLAQEAIAGGEVGSETGYSAQFPRAVPRAATASPGAWLTGVVLFDNGRAMDLRGRA
jgi:hypothetical protein